VSLGIPPPADLPRDQWAAWYWSTVKEAIADHDDGVDRCELKPSGGCPIVEDLISGAIDAGVVGHRIPVAGFGELQPLHSLLAPYRRDLAREDEERSAWLAGAHEGAVRRRRSERRQSW
jgi:hypothetical protein